MTPTPPTPKDTPDDQRRRELMTDLEHATYRCLHAALRINVFVREALRSGYSLNSHQAQRLLEANERLDHVIRMLRRNEPNAQ